MISENCTAHYWHQCSHRIRAASKQTQLKIDCTARRLLGTFLAVLPAEQLGKGVQICMSWTTTSISPMPPESSASSGKADVPVCLEAVTAQKLRGTAALFREAVQTKSHSVLDSDKGLVPRPHDYSARSDADSEGIETPLRLNIFIARGRGAAKLLSRGCIAITAVHNTDKLLLGKQQLLRTHHSSKSICWQAAAA